MSTFYSAQTGGFYNDGIHGTRLVSVPDPAWARPLIDVVLQPAETYGDTYNDGEEAMALGEVPDIHAVHPTIEVPNPDCKLPPDAVEITNEQHAALLAGQSAGQRIVPDENGCPVLADQPPLTADEIKTALSVAVQDHMDAAAKAAGYDDIKSAVTYAEEPAVAKFQAEGLAFRAWRSLVWAACYAVMADVETGARPVPTALELIAELPVLELPA